MKRILEIYNKLDKNKISMLLYIIAAILMLIFAIIFLHFKHNNLMASTSLFLMISFFIQAFLNFKK